MESQAGLGIYNLMNLNLRRKQKRRLPHQVGARWKKRENQTKFGV